MKSSPTIKLSGLNDWFAEMLVTNHGAEKARAMCCGNALEAVERVIEKKSQQEPTTIPTKLEPCSWCGREKFPNELSDIPHMGGLVCADCRADQGPDTCLEEGDNCPQHECDGKMGYGRVMNCSCHISPPCNACVDNPLVCLECGWEAPQ